MHMQSGGRGNFTVTQAAAGGENDIRLRVYGDLGMLDWSHRNPSYLRVAMQGEAVREISRGDPDLPPAIIAAGRTPRGHPEGLREAFANIYAEVAQERMARALGEPAPDAPTRGSRKARTRWRSSRPAWRRRARADGSTLRELRCVEVYPRRDLPGSGARRGAARPTPAGEATRYSRRFALRRVRDTVITCRVTARVGHGARVAAASLRCGKFP
jgi:hypothetical protein